MIITISGPPGAGKTTVARLLAEKTGFRLLTVGKIFEKIAVELLGPGIRDEVMNKLWETLTPSELMQLHNKIDAHVREIVKEGDWIVDGRLSALDIPSADLKVFLTASFEVRAARIAERDRISLEEARKILKEKEENEIKGFERIYGVDYRDFSLYDLVINTERFSPEEIAEIILTAVRVCASRGKASGSS